MKNWEKCISCAVFAFGLAVLSPSAFGAPASQKHGIVLSGEAKQDYIQKEMDALYHPAKNTAAKPWSPPNGWVHERLTIGDVPVERIAPTKSAAQRIILLLHGGGYMGGITDRYRALSVRQATYMDAAEVYNVDYRLAPAHVYPAALEDAEAVYRGLLTHGIAPSNIIIFGDSSGGNLALALALRLKEQGLAQPALLLLLSPWVDFEHKDGTSRTENFEKDKMLGAGTPFADAVRKAPPYAGSLPLDDPRLSLIHADLSGLPPMLVQTGGYDLLLTEDEQLAEKAAADGTPVTLSVYPEMPHVFPLVLPELAESFTALEEMRDFVNRYMNKLP